MIKNDSLNRLDDRAVSVAVTHVLAIGITTILIVGLLTAAGGMAEQEQERSAQKQLQMIGSAMANQIERADELGRRGANVTVREEFEGTVSGQSYTVELENDCYEPTIETSACLVLNLTNSDISTTVGVSNRSLVNFEHLGSGTVRIVSEPGGVSGDAPYNPSILQQIGVGSTVFDLPPISGGRASNEEPVAEFSVDPMSPQWGDIVILNASESFDPEGNISKYVWNITEKGDPDPGRFNQTTHDPTMSIPTGKYEKLDIVPLDAGRYTVKLTVVGSSGDTAETMKFVKVAGLVYGGNAKARDYNGDVPGGLKFEITNKHSSKVNLTEMYIDLQDENIKYLHEEMGSVYPYPYYPYEILINNTEQTGALEVGDTSYDNIEIYEGGQVIEKTRWDQFAIVDEEGTTYDTATVHFIEFYNSIGNEVNMSGKSGDIALRYYLENGGEKTYFSTQFNFTADSPYPERTIPSTKAQNWQAGSKGPKAQVTFNRIDDITLNEVNFKIIDKSYNLREYNWSNENKNPYLKKKKVKNDKVMINSSLKQVSISEKGYLVVEVTVKNSLGSETKRLYIEIDP